MLLVLAGASAGEDDPAMPDRQSRAECQMWAKLENKTLPLQNQGHANCTTNERCTGFHCDGMYQVQWLNLKIYVVQLVCCRSCT